MTNGVVRVARYEWQKRPRGKTGIAVNGATTACISPTIFTSLGFSAVMLRGWSTNRAEREARQIHLEMAIRSNVEFLCSPLERGYGV